LANLNWDIEYIEEKAAQEQPVENLSENIHNIIYSVIDQDIIESGAQLSPDQKQKAIAKLKEYGVFEIKGTISEVAKVMGMSESSVYRYLRLVSLENHN